MSTTTIEVVHQESGVVRVVFQSENGVHILLRDVLDQLKSVLKVLKGDKSLRVLVFESQGRTFLAGADLKELGMLTRKSARRFAHEGQRLFQRLAELPAVTIAAIHAPCAGGGTELALACDLRLAAASARIGLPEVTLGILPGWGGTVRSTVLFGPAVAKRVIFSGELLPAAEAARLGVVDAVFSDAEFRAGVNSRVAQFLKAGPAAVASVKQLIEDIYAVEFDDLLEMEAERFANCYATNEPAEGTAAFLEKRPAQWGAARSS